jgi:hypothetical protein
MSRSSIPLWLYSDEYSWLTQVRVYSVTRVSYRPMLTKLWMESESEWVTFIMS